MNTLIIKDAALDPEVAEMLHADLMKAEYKDMVSPADGVTYPTICTSVEMPNAQALLASLHRNAKPDDVKINLSGFRLGILGDKDDTFCHIDTIYDSQWAAVLYIGKVCHGGTAFWKHLHTGIDLMPDRRAIEIAGADYNAWHRWMTLETARKDSWVLDGFAAMKFNRIITYPTAKFHSRTPGDIAPPFGNRVDTGRLVWVAFYDVAPTF